MDWLSSNWPTAVGWLVTVAISVIGWAIEARARRNGERETDRQLKALAKQADSLEALSLTTARKDESDPWGQPIWEARHAFRIVNESQRTVTVTGIRLEWGYPDTDVPYDCGPGDCIRYVCTAASGPNGTVRLEWHFKDAPGKERESVRKTPLIS